MARYSLSLRNKGFSLVELSIVIVIIALIIAGVTAGQSAIKQMQFRSVINDVGRINSSINSYKLQYNAFPGDHSSAYNYFGSNCASTASDCNGNGNNQIDVTSIETDNEMFRIWQHLNLSNLFPGNYTGVAVSGGDGNIATGGVNVPKSPLGNNSSYAIRYIAAGGWTGQTVRTANMIYLGQDRTTTWNTTAFIKVNDAYAFDLKYDDGKPYLGNILGAHTGHCGTGSNAAGTYRVGINDVCALGFYVQ